MHTLLHIPHHKPIARHQPHLRPGRRISERSINTINISRKEDHVGNAKLECKTLYKEEKRKEPNRYSWPTFTLARHINAKGNSSETRYIPSR